MRVSISSEVVPEIREYERTSTTIANVYVQARVDRYLRRTAGAARARLDYRPAFHDASRRRHLRLSKPPRAFRSVCWNPGPAAGALAARKLRPRRRTWPDLVSFDMGGTTAKFCVIDRRQALDRQGV